MNSDFYGGMFPLDGMFDSIYSQWNRLFQEKDGYKSFQTQSGYVLVFNTVGVSERDIKVAHETTKDPISDKHQQTRIIVKGITSIPELKNQSYSVDYDVVLRGNDKEIDKVMYKVKDGLTIVFIKTKNPAKIESTATKLSGDDLPDW